MSSCCNCVCCSRRVNFVCCTHDVESMDNRLETILSSNLPEPKKKELIDQIAEKGRDQHPSNDVNGVLNLSIGWILQGSSELQVSSGMKLFSSWAHYHVGAIENVLPRDLLTNFFTKPSRNQANLPFLLYEVLTLTQNHGNGKLFQQYLKVIETKAHVFVQESPGIPCVRNLVSVLMTFKDSLPKGDMNSRLAVPLIRSLALNPIPTDEQLVAQFIKDVTMVTEFLQQTWSLPSYQNVVMDCLKELFNIISVVDGPEPSQCLGALVGIIPLEWAKNGIRSVVADNRTTDQAMNQALQRLLDWLMWPSCQNVDHWTIACLKQLAMDNKFNILISVIENKVDEVMEKMKYPPVREASFNILTCMLLGCQYSPQPFHKILPRVREVLEVLEREGGEVYREWRGKLANLIHCLIYLHTGFPDLYDPILDLFKDIPSPTTQEIQERLNKERWMNQECGSGVGVGRPSDTCSELAQKSDTGKVGLANLGNTCYVNSVLQTLFMCDEFQRRTLMRTPTEDEKLLTQLQLVFATLRLSQRPSWKPTQFLAASRPAEFGPGEGQDCSEFLRYLLNQIHDQQLNSHRIPAKEENAGTKGNNSPASKPPTAQPASNSSPSRDSNPMQASAFDSTVVRKTFGFKLQTTTCCLDCNHKSVQVEDFMDLNLAFPKTKSSTTSPVKALAGGGSPSSSTPKDGSPKQDDLEAAQASDKRGKVTHLSELLEHLLQPERLEEENKYACVPCGGLRDAEKTSGILESPEYLILILMRFNMDIRQTVHSKLFNDVTCPPTLAVPVVPSNSSTSVSAKNTRFNRAVKHLKQRFPSGEEPTLDNTQLYGLCSMIVHSGPSPNCGHYFCYSRPSKMKNVDSVLHNMDNGKKPVELDFLEDNWCLFNDEHVSQTTYSSFSQLAQRYPNDTPYMLVYKKLSLDSQATPVPAEPQVRQEMCDAISMDNDAFVKEQEQAAKAQTGRARSGSTSSIALVNWHISDTDQQSDNTQGPKLETSGTRFVF